MIDLNNIPCFTAECGPLNDRRSLNITLPPLRRKLGVLISGGLDSAILYYILRKLVAAPYILTPYIIVRDESSILSANKVIQYINCSLNIPNQSPIIIEIDQNIESHFQVSAGLSKIINHPKCNKIYMGIIETLPEHSIGFEIFKPIDNEIISYPLKNLNKSHIIELIIQYGLDELFNITHSCVYPYGRCDTCNRCNERKWAFSRLGLQDSGTN